MRTKRRPNSTQAYTPVQPKIVLDATDIRVLKAMLEDPRLPISRLAKLVKMSRPSVGDRIRKLETQGVIRGWSVDLDPSMLGFPLTCYVRIRPGQGHHGTVANLAQQTPQVVECHRITGEDCILLKVVIESMSDLGQLLDRFLPYGQTTTSVIQSSPVAPRPPPLPKIQETVT